MSKPTVFNYQEYVNLQAECDKLREENTNLKIRTRIMEANARIRETSYWEDHKGQRDDRNRHSLYCARCGAWAETRTAFCGSCGRKMENPTVDTGGE